MREWMEKMDVVGLTKMCGRKMSMWRIATCAVQLFALASCATTPSVRFDGYTPQYGKLPLNVALIISDNLKNAIHKTYVTARCIQFESGTSMKKFAAIAVIGAENAVGAAAEELFVKGLPYLFSNNKVDVYKVVSEIKNLNEYDYIIVPNVTVKTSYDEKAACIRKVIPMEKGLNVREPFGIAASVDYKLFIRDSKNNEIIEITSIGSSVDKTNVEYCADSHSWKELTRSYKIPIENSMSYAFKELLQKTDLALQPLAQAKSERLARPSDLSLAVSLSDTSAFFPNNILDAGESAELAVTVKNAGKGAGYGTVLEVSTDNPKIAYDRMIPVGDIQPGETKEIKIKLKAGLDIADGKTPVQLHLKEKRGYDAKKVVLNVPTARLQKPNLAIVSTEINDGDTGLAKGNGNGIPESGETVELTVLIKNEGVGKAIGVNLAGTDLPMGIQWVRDSSPVGAIQPGETARAKLAFSIPRNFDGRDIAANLKVADTRGVSDAAKTVTYAFARRSPDLQYAWKIYEKEVPVMSVANGGNYDLEMIVFNKGQISARDVSVVLSALGITLARTRIDAGDIKEGTASPVYRIAMSIPRTFTNLQILLDVRIAQADFGQASSSISIPVQVKGPKLRYEGIVLGRRGKNTLEQGEQAVLDVAVHNDGNLPAEGVTVRVASKDDNLKIQGATEVVIGNIPSNARSETVRFQLSTLRRIKVGSALLDVHIGQRDFSSINTQYVLNIAEEAATLVEVASEDRGKDARRARSGSGPSIALLTAPSGLTIYEETFRLAFDVKDTRNIERIDVTINGIRQPLTQQDGLTAVASTGKQIIKNIRLNEGENRVVVTAHNIDNLFASKEMIINRVGQEDVDTPVVTGMNNPNGIAVVIGVSKYENPNIPSVDYARRDAMKVREYLIKSMGYKDVNILELYDDKATVSKIKNTLNRELRSKVTSNSDVFVYFSGHGLPDTNANEPYLTTYDVVPENPNDNAYSMKDFYGHLESLKARSIMVVIDACFSGMTDSDTKKILPLVKSASPVFIEVPNPLLKNRNAVVFTSSRGKQISSWYHKKQHGLFTYYFLQGLRGKADLDGSGVVTAKGMERYLSQHVPQEAAKLYSREQTPEVIGNKDIILVKFR